MNLFATSNIGNLTAFTAGILSFFTPCILPIIPGFIAYFISGEENHFIKSLLNSIFFVLGLSFVFINMGFLSGYFGSFLTDNRIYINIIGGIIVIIFGLYIMEVIKIPFLGKMSVSTSIKNKKNIFSSFILGLIFSLVWSPCLSPTLGTILVISSQSANASRGAFLLGLYSSGFAIPFILSAILLERFSLIFKKIEKHQKRIEQITGIILIIIGVIMIFGIMDKLAMIGG